MVRDRLILFRLNLLIVRENEMVNIWKYSNAKDPITITTVDGKKYRGKVIDVMPADYDEGAIEDSIVIDCNGLYEGFSPSEIESID